jgi:cysteate synthase
LFWLKEVRDMDFQSTPYTLRCVECGKTFVEDDHLLSCDELHGPALLRADYAARQLSVRDDGDGMFRFGDWLPLRRPVKTSGVPVSFHGEKLGRALGLDDLWIAFSGYWPERGADMKTCTFKELEAPPVCSRFDDTARTLVVASAGNTARAFAEVCSANDIPLVLVVHEAGLDSLWSTRPFSDSVVLVGVDDGADYFDAIQVADMIAKRPGYAAEGGAKNVARRDGMGTVLLSAAVMSGRIPDHYFQAVGSGTGGIASWEAAGRLLEDGRFGGAKMKLHLAQNHPFTPMTDAWRAGSRALLEVPEAELKSRLSRVSAHVLSNRKPPYGIRGGVFDALSDTGGSMSSVTNEQAAEAASLFERLEGIDLDPAAAVAAAALIEAVDRHLISTGDMVLLNITGGGKRRLFEEFRIHRLVPRIMLKRREATEEAIRRFFG